MTTIRNNLGCCVNTFFNNTEILGVIFEDILDYYLWSNCSVEPPNSTCNGELSFTLPATPTQTCTFDDYEGCQEGDFNTLRTSLTGQPASCDVVVQYNLDRCSRMPRPGSDACILGLGTDTLTPPTQNGIQAIAYNCYSARALGSCSSSCMQRFSANLCRESRMLREYALQLHVCSGKWIKLFDTILSRHRAV